MSDTTVFVKNNRPETFTEQVTFEGPIVCTTVSLDDLNVQPVISNITVNTSLTLGYLPVTDDYGSIIGYIRIHPA